MPIDLVVEDRDTSALKSIDGLDQPGSGADQVREIVTTSVLIYIWIWWWLPKKDSVYFFQCKLSSPTIGSSPPQQDEYQGFGVYCSNFKTGCCFLQSPTDSTVYTIYMQCHWILLPVHRLASNERIFGDMVVYLLTLTRKVNAHTVISLRLPCAVSVNSPWIEETRKRKAFC